MIQLYHSLTQAQRIQYFTSQIVAQPHSLALYFQWLGKWKQLRYPSSGEWIMKIRYICTVLFYSAIKED